MQKQKENLFSVKFRHLNSQEQGADINWTSSDSSDFDNVSNNERFSNLTNKVCARKRKRKKKVPKNISNLNVTIIDIPKDNKEVINGNKLPNVEKNTNLSELEKSPVFVPSVYFPPYKSVKVEPSSPILMCQVDQQTKAKVLEKSPILLLKYSSPRSSPNVKKKLFKANDNSNAIKKEILSENEPPLINKNVTNPHLDKRKIEFNGSRTISEVRTATTENKEILSNRKKSMTEKEIKLENGISEVKEEYNQKLQLHLDDSFDMLKTTNTNLIKRVKSYFDNHFSSETPSQHSISDSFTPKSTSKTSDELDIISFVTQVNSNRASSQSEQEMLSKNLSPISSQSAEMGMEKSKKIHYKKDGLAYRLNTLLKKQNANISLWQHERFLAENSNFLIPKGEHITLRIQKAIFKYGCFMIEAVNINDCRFIIVVNTYYVQNDNFTETSILKLYEPYKIVDYKKDCKLIINVCKFECVTLNE